MMLVEDTRNQVGKHKALNDKLNSLGVAVLRSKLYVGDYSRLDNMTTCIDTKKDWVELAGNICGKQHERFKWECIRAQQAEIRLVVLIEEEVDLLDWTSPKRRNGALISHINPQTLQKAMSTMTERYGVEFDHCGKEKTAEKILEILGHRGTPQTLDVCGEEENPFDKGDLQQQGDNEKEVRRNGNY